MGHPAQTSLTERLRGVESEIAAGRAESVLPRCLELATLYPRALAVQRVLGEIYLAMRRPREALAALDRALAGDPEDARACCARAIVHQMHGDQMAALAWYHRACDIRPEDATLRATYREMAAGLGQPPYQPGRVGLARIYLRGDLFAHAIREWETLIAENADSVRLEAHVGLVETLWRAGRPQDAEAWARRVLTNVPSCLKPLLIAGVVAHDEGRDADAEPFLRRAADLDPDHRTARALLADRLATGDATLGALIWGDTPPADGFGVVGPSWERVSHGPTSGQRPTEPAERRVNRPLMSGNPVTATSLTRSRPDLTAPSIPLPPPPARTNDLPPGFHSMFKETEGMLWRPGESDPDTLRATPGAPLQTAPSARTLEPEQAPIPPPLAAALEAMAPPPAIAESGFALGDTEMRRAIRWVQWLQAQGARAFGDEPQRSRPSGSLEALLNSPPGASQPADHTEAPPPVPPVSALPSMPSLPSGPLPPGSPPSMPSPPSSALASGPLPPPSSEDLRQMFAELDPIGPARDEPGVIDSSLVPADPPRAKVTGAPLPDATIEQLDRQGAEDGFMPFTLEPGALAALAGEDAPPYEEEDSDAAWAGEHPSAEPVAPYHEPVVSYDEPAALYQEPTAPYQEPAPERAEAAPVPEPLLASPPAGPDPHDYAARLEQARSHRDSGAMDEAIVEYRTVVRNAPELLPDVLADVESCLIERPEHPELHRLLGDARIRQGDYLGALESYNRAVALTQSLDN